MSKQKEQSSTETENKMPVPADINEKVQEADSPKPEPLFVFMDFKIGKEKVGRVVMELFKDIAPKTCENFRALCTGEKGIGQSGHVLHYKGSFIHKAVPSFMIQGGDITNFDGSGGDTIYGPTFEDENFKMKMLDVGVVGMANLGRPDSNSSQFFISCAPFPHLEGRNVAFGKVRKGLGVVEEICTSERNAKDVPAESIVIEDCGELPPGADWDYAEKDGLDQYPPYPEDWELDDNDKADWLKKVTTAIEDIKETGNQYFHDGDYTNANRKYKKVLRFINWMKTHQLNPDNLVDPSRAEKVDQQYVTCLLNMAATKLRLKQYRAACQLCNEIIQLEPAAKAYYRRGQANFGLNNYDASLRDLTAAQQLEPSDCHIRREVARVKGAIKHYAEEERKRYGKMLQ